MGGPARIIAAFFVVAIAASAQSKKLTIERIALHQIEDGPVLDANYEFVPGETVHFSCRISGYHIETTDEARRVKLSWKLRAEDPQGVLLEKEQPGVIDEPLLPQDKNWIPKFLSSFVIPPYAPGGTFRIAVQVRDELGHTDVAGELKFRVRARTIEPSDTLIARNFQFLRNEDDAAGLRSAIYKPGQMLWARFEIAGYKFADNNHFSVEYGLAVLNSESKELFSQPVAANESKESFYPQRYVSGMLSLSLDPYVAKGSYILLVTVRDQVGSQIFETRQPFQIEP